MADLRFDTKKIKAGYSPLDNNLAISPPIYQTAAYDFKSTEHAQNLFTYKEAGYLYTRVGNPTVNYFSERVKALDGAKNAVAVGSGMAAISYTAALLTHLTGFSPNSALISSSQMRCLTPKSSIRRSQMM